jgi:predicted transcriptional regulator
MDETREVLTPAVDDLIGITTDVVAAYLARNHVPATDLPLLLASVHAAFAGLGQSPSSAEPEANKLTSSQIRRSIRPDVLISFEDNKPYKTLKRHLAKFGLSPEEYRAKWGLPRDYPMTAASYSEQRSKSALSHGLGRHRKNGAPKLALVTGAATEPSEHDGAAPPTAKRAARREPRKSAAK